MKGGNEEGFQTSWNDSQCDLTHELLSKYWLDA